MSHSQRFQWDEIQALSNPETNIIALTHVGAILLHACAAWYDNRRLWFVGDEPVNDAEWDDISKTIGLMEHQLMSGLVGVILPHVLGSLSGFSMLPCDGSSYARADWPLLYDAIDPIYRIDSDNFRVPDMRERFPYGQGGGLDLDDSGGETEHLLLYAEMPVHEHSETIAVPAIINGGLEAPASAAVPSAGVTGSAGGSEPHNNMPPFRVVRFAIVAG